MARCPFGYRVLAGFVGGLLFLAAGCTPSSPGPASPASRPAPSESAKPNDTGPGSSRVTPPEHIPGR
jgi:hypothetical protein